PGPLSHARIDFGARPPRVARLALYNGSDAAAAWTVETPVVVTAAWEAGAAVAGRGGNVTVVDLVGVWGAEWVRLEVEGCWVGDGEGATVAEFAVVAAAGEEGTGGVREEPRRTEL
ncbi:glycosyl hydrolase family 65 central catalytic domain-containing protein, partial [Neofusicoccum parvum]